MYCILYVCIYIYVYDSIVISLHVSITGFLACISGLYPQTIPTTANHIRPSWILAPRRLWTVGIRTVAAMGRQPFHKCSKVPR